MTSEPHTCESAPLQLIGAFLTSEQAQRLLGEIASVSAAIGMKFFDALAEYVSRRLGVDYVFIGELEPGGRHVRTLRFRFCGRVVDNLTYPVAGTPCETVLREGLRAYPAGVQRSFPDDCYLVEQAIEGYLGVPLTSAGGKVLGLMSIMHRAPLTDVQVGETVLRIFAPRAAAEIERRHIAAALDESERMLAGVMSNLPGMVYRCRHDEDWTLEFASDGCLALTGYSPEDLVDNRRISFQQMIHPDDLDNVARLIDAALKARRPFQLVYRLQTAQGAWRWAWEQGQGVFAPSGEFVAIDGIIMDITERVRIQERLHYLAHHDPLTELPNRTLFADRLEQALRRARRGRHGAALLFLDLDGFKEINDTLGHEVGDRVLQAVARRLKSCVRDSDSVARLAGDEFAVLLENMAQADDARRVSEKILGALTDPIPVGECQLRVTCSIGISLYPDDLAPVADSESGPAPDHGADVLLRNADLAMYRAKQRGPNGYAFYARGTDAPAGNG